ncbi:MAG: peptidase C1A papain, partial [Gemmatimonadota bacterium]
RSLLWLVSASFEGGQATPILGMEKFYRDYAGRLKNATAVAGPGPQSASTTHGGFDDDELTQQRVIEFIRQ